MCLGCLKSPLWNLRHFKQGPLSRIGRSAFAETSDEVGAGGDEHYMIGAFPSEPHRPEGGPISKETRDDPPRGGGPWESAVPPGPGKTMVLCAPCMCATWIGQPPPHTRESTPKHPTEIPWISHRGLWESAALPGPEKSMFIRAPRMRATWVGHS